MCFLERNDASRAAGYISFLEPTEISFVTGQKFNPPPPPQSAFPPFTYKLIGRLLHRHEGVEVLFKCGEIRPRGKLLEAIGRVTHSRTPHSLAACPRCAHSTRKDLIIRPPPRNPKTSANLDRRHSPSQNQDLEEHGTSCAEPLLPGWLCGHRPPM